jgi:hypothetical protein
MKNSTQIRVRLPGINASKWLELPPSSRAKAVAVVLNAWGEIDLKELVAMRRELVNLGTLLNQSLAVSYGQGVDEKSLSQCVGLLKKLTNQ